MDAKSENAGAGLVLDDDRLLPGARQLVAECACDDIDGPPAG